MTAKGNVKAARLPPVPLLLVTVQVPFTSVATCTGVPLLFPLDVTTAVRLPSDDGGVEIVTVNWVVVDAVTVPMTPRLKATVLLAGVAEKFVPVMVRVVLVSGRLLVLRLTVGVGPLEAKV